MTDPRAASNPGPTLPANLLAVVAATPDDDGPRLVAADWFAEHGDSERAELVTLQCRLARLHRFDPVREPMEARARALELANGPRWAPAPQGVSIGFVRGFPEVVHGDVEAVAQAAAELASSAPTVSGLALSGLDGRLPLNRLFECALWPRTHRLELEGPSEAFTVALLQAGGLDRLLTLSLSHARLTHETWRMLSARAGLAWLERLRLHQCNAGLWARETAGLELPARLRDLDLEVSGVSADDLERLARSSVWPRLEALSLCWNPLSEELGPLFAAHPAPALRELDLSMCKLGPRGLAALAAVEGVSLRALGLRHDDLGGNALRPLLDAACVGEVERLDVRANAIEPQTRLALQLKFGAALSL